jgi:hypothetical protein
MKHTSDGSTADYYEMPKGAEELQHLISYRDMNGQIAEIFRACYRYGIVSHSPKLRDAKKIKFYIEAEIARLEKYDSQDRTDPFPDTHLDFDDERMDIIARNGNNGEHYADDMSDPANWRAGDLVCFYGEPKGFFTPTRIYTLRDSGSTEELKTVDDDDHPHFISFPHARENFRFHSRPSADGWIDWSGGECPCDELSEVEVHTRGGYTRAGKARSFLWRHVAGSCGDIIRYRML